MVCFLALTEVGTAMASLAEGPETHQASATDMMSPHGLRGSPYLPRPEYTSSVLLLYWLRNSDGQSGNFLNIFTFYIVLTPEFFFFSSSPSVSFIPKVPWPLRSDRRMVLGPVFILMWSEWWEVLTFLCICCHIRCDVASKDLKIIYHEDRDTEDQGLLFTSTDFVQTRKLIMVKSEDT